jgi:hypothetical protein
LETKKQPPPGVRTAEKAGAAVGLIPCDALGTLSSVALSSAHMFDRRPCEIILKGSRGKLCRRKESRPCLTGKSRIQSCWHLFAVPNMFERYDLEAFARYADLDLAFGHVVQKKNAAPVFEQSALTLHPLTNLSVSESHIPPAVWKISP